MPNGEGTQQSWLGNLLSGLFSTESATDFMERMGLTWTETSVQSEFEPDIIDLYLAKNFPANRDWLPEARNYLKQIAIADITEKYKAYREAGGVTDISGYLGLAEAAPVYTLPESYYVQGAGRFSFDEAPWILAIRGKPEYAQIGTMRMWAKETGTPVSQLYEYATRTLREQGISNPQPSEVMNWTTNFLRGQVEQGDWKPAPLPSQYWGGAVELATMPGAALTWQMQAPQRAETQAQQTYEEYLRKQYPTNFPLVESMKRYFPNFYQYYQEQETEEVFEKWLPKQTPLFEELTGGAALATEQAFPRTRYQW